MEPLLTGDQAAQCRFVVVDPSLRDARGHHYAVSKRITASARAAGFRPVWLCHRDAAIADSEGAELVRHLSISLYDAYLPKKEQAAGAAAMLRHLWARLFKPGRGSSESADLKLGRDLASACMQMKIGSGDRLLFHTADGMTYGAIDHFLRQCPRDRLPRIHVCTPYDPVGIMPNRIADRPVDAIIRGWQSRGLIGDRIFLHGENARLAAHLAAIWQADVRALPLPASQALDKGSPETAPWSGAALKIAYLGPARVEKGFHLLPDIVAKTLQLLGRQTESGSDRQVQFAIQATPQIVGYAPQVLGAIERLRKYPSHVVRLIEQALDEDEYLGLIASCDVILMPYGQREYRYRSSGIVSEALSMDKIIVATEGTYPASAIGLDAGIAAGTACDFAEAIVHILQELPRYRAGAAREGARYRADCAVERYVLRCMEAEGQRPSHGGGVAALPAHALSSVGRVSGGAD